MANPRSRYGLGLNRRVQELEEGVPTISAEETQQRGIAGPSVNLPVLPSIDQDTPKAFLKWARIMLDTCNVWFQQIVDAFAVTRRLIDSVLADAQSRVRWIYPYVLGNTYIKNDMVRDGSWVMIANKDTIDRAAPVATGSPFYTYAGLSPTAPVSAKQIISGNRFTFGAGGYLNGYRVYTVSGNVYSVASIIDPLGVAEVNQLVTFTATVTGWTEFSFAPLLVLPNTTIDLVQTVQEPNPTPTTFQGTWSYQKPNNASIPLSGQISHATRQLDQLRVHYIDANAGDRTAEIQGLDVGDVVEDDVGTRWSVQSNADQGTWTILTVAPAVHSGDIGNRVFTFETVSPTPITRMEDVNYWGLNPPQTGSVEGLYIVDGPYGDIIPNTSAYGTDLLLQQADVSPDWDYVTVSSLEPAEGTQRVSTEVGTQDVAVSNVVETTDLSWTTVWSAVPVTWGKIRTLARAKRTDDVGYYAGSMIALYWDSGAPFVDAIQEYEIGNTLLATRFIVVGNSVEFQVRGRNNQTWAWEVTNYVVNYED